MKKNWFPILFILVLAACHRPDTTSSSVTEATGQKFARWFTVDHSSGHTVVTVLNPFDTTRPAARLVLYPRNSPKPDGFDGYTFVPVPLQRIAVTSSTAITFASRCGHLDAVVSLSDQSFVFNPVIKQRLAKGEVKEIAQGTDIWYEKLSASGPEAIFASLFDGQRYDRIRELGIIVIPFADYLETTPLGRAEWIRFMGLFFGEEQKADVLFDTITTRYQRIARLAMTTTERPRIFDGLPFEGTWYVSGGQSYMAAMYRDAAADYVWAGEPGTASCVMAFEKVFAEAAHVPWWRMVVNFPDSLTKKRLLSLDERYGLFEAVKTGGVIWSNAATVPLFEEGVAEPDVVLADLVSILHPNLLPNHKSRYYFRLKL